MAVAYLDDTLTGEPYTTLLDSSRHDIGDFNGLDTKEELKLRQQETYEKLKRELETARSHLTS